MSNDQKVVIKSRGVGFFGILFIVLLVLKVGVAETVVVKWSWWLVTAPLWAPACLLFGIISVVFLVMMGILLIRLMVEKIADRSKKRAEARRKKNG